MMKRTSTGNAETTAPNVSNQIKAVFMYAAFSFSILIIAFLLVAQAFAKPAPQEKSEPRRTDLDQPIELGDVRWLRDLETAVSNSKKQNKPIAILFQEVPG